MSKPDRFRTLIIGRANAGKTTILRAVCGTEEEPDVYDQEGKLVSGPSKVSTLKFARGEHNIEYSLIFPSNPQFVFHDSRGFESGSIDELELVRDFIRAHASKGSMKKQLHAIWYCFPADSNRIITAAEQEFFKSIDTGRVPVIAVFTKFDALDAAACGELCAQGVSLGDAQRRAPQLAQDKFEKSVIPLISSQPHPPKAVVCLRSIFST
ncbi:hypothetical protein BOTBODRAFT_112597 [Botryobasidium botryosum FD-172 SS1]|uniref:Uncharacterized protein n=1 Tax=Botryobasidium botryosum (strain FD-172 SS1) TaxID=930990 RepID=A0A067MLY3_BOTB1|nr:hypothetical protein BOTBODRAFT_112597 [Botryobasidium botryosum FD-172 SS1]